jgi:hypothetical protein
LANLGQKIDDNERQLPPPMAKEYQVFRTSKGLELSKKLQDQKGNLFL